MCGAHCELSNDKLFSTEFYYSKQDWSGRSKFIFCSPTQAGKPFSLFLIPWFQKACIISNMFSWEREGCEKGMIGKVLFVLLHVFQYFAEVGG